MKSKSGDDVTKAMESVLVLGRVPKNLHVNRGPEFYNSKFKSLTTRYGIKLHSTYSNLEALICEHFNRTLKGYTPNWTTEISPITQVGNTHPVTYKLKDYRYRPIAAGFYEQELLKVEHPDIHLVKKVLKKRGRKIYVD
ncbi:uncharacterized protein [Neodiprion pinetum]|uniref:uncharacterized protein n=1 Tax=Neodiprion pinetum TaxID=441929 RepID=UPI003723FA8F